jgi:hypothetical protein
MHDRHRRGPRRVARTIQQIVVVRMSVRLKYSKLEISKVLPVPRPKKADPAHVYSKLSKELSVCLLSSIHYTVEDRLDGCMTLLYFDSLNHLYLIHLFDLFAYHLYMILLNMVNEHLLLVGVQLKVEFYLFIKFNFSLA